MPYSELNSSLHVLRSGRVDANDGHASLGARYTERCVKVAGANSTIFKHVCLEVGCFHGPWLAGTPVSIGPYLSKGGTIAGGRIHRMTSGRSGVWVDKWTRQLTFEGGELQCGRPAIITVDAGAGGPSSGEATRSKKYYCRSSHGCAAERKIHVRWTYDLISRNLH
jgi:hypothetical protein